MRALSATRAPKVPRALYYFSSLSYHGFNVAVFKSTPPTISASASGVSESLRFASLGSGQENRPYVALP